MTSLRATSVLIHAELRGITYSAWVTKLGFNACNWKRRWLVVSGPDGVYYPRRPAASAPCKPSGGLHIGYRAEGVVGLSSVEAVAAGRCASLVGSLAVISSIYYHTAVGNIIS